jgi:hypothetical protein
MAYRIYTESNMADTWRDPSEILTGELGYRHSLDDAKSLAMDYIKDNFYHTNTQIEERRDGTFTATDFRSYGETIIIEPITIS